MVEKAYRYRPKRLKFGNSQRPPSLLRRHPKKTPRGRDILPWPSKLDGQGVSAPRQQSWHAGRGQGPGAPNTFAANDSSTTGQARQPPSQHQRHGIRSQCKRLETGAGVVHGVVRGGAVRARVPDLPAPDRTSEWARKTRLVRFRVASQLRCRGPLMPLPPTFDGKGVMFMHQRLSLGCRRNSGGSE